MLKTLRFYNTYMGRPHIQSQLAKLHNKTSHIYTQNKNDKPLVPGWLHEPKQSVTEIVPDTINSI